VRAGAQDRTKPSVSRNSLGVFTARLNPIGEQRLFEFLDALDTNSAARFRSWLVTASDADLSAAAQSLSRTSHGREFVAWWNSHAQSDSMPVTQVRRRHRRKRSSRRHSRIHLPTSDNDFVVGGAWLLGGLLVTIVSYSFVATSPGGGHYIIATGAIVYGVFRLFRGLKTE
jgi:hypothetical protein